MKLRFAIFVLVALSLWTTCGSAQATEVRPMIVEISSVGAGTTGRVEIRNVTNRTVPYEMRMFRVSVNEDSEVTQEPADENFLVFPPQMALQPGERQVVRVQWLGDPDLTHSEAYYLLVRQVPVDLSGTPNSGIQVITNFNVLVNVVPPGAEARLAATDFRATQAEDGSHRLGVRIENTGNKYANMGMVGVTFRGRTASGAAFERTYSAQQAAGVFGVGYVGPNASARWFEIPVDEPVDPASVEVSFN